MLRVMTYNIKNGGGADRLDAVVRVVGSRRPDLLALQELRGFGRDGAAVLADVADRLGMTAFLGPSYAGQPVAVLVRDAAAVIDSRPLRRPFKHAAVRVRVRTDRGPLTVIGTHLHPLHPGWRLREARWLARQCPPGRSVLIMGDLNSLDPWGEHADRVAQLAPRDRARHLRRDGTVDTRAVALLGRAGLVDVFRRLGSVGRDHTAPTEGLGGAEFSRLRLDYVLASADLADAALSCGVADDGETATASDHYPVIADFRLSLAGARPSRPTGAADREDDSKW